MVPEQLRSSRALWVAVIATIVVLAMYGQVLGGLSGSFSKLSLVASPLCPPVDSGRGSENVQGSERSSSQAASSSIPSSSSSSSTSSSAASSSSEASSSSSSSSSSTSSSSSPSSFPYDIEVSGLKLRYVPPETIQSSVHCVGDSFTPSSWMFRSCSFRNLCFDTVERDFVLFRSKKDSALTDLLVDPLATSASTTFSGNVSIGGINPRWNESRDRLKWFPRVLDSTSSSQQGHYVPADPSSPVLVPFHSMAGINVGHLVWDDFFPIYTLASMFGFQARQLLLLRHVIKPPGLWATCEDLYNGRPNDRRCDMNFEKLMPMMGSLPKPPVNTRDGFKAEDLRREAGGKGLERDAKLVCFKNAVAGLGQLTDHGMKLHGWNKEDYFESVNVGRGSQMWDFRVFGLRNLGVEDVSLGKKGSAENPRRITVSTHSSNGPRKQGFELQIDALKKHFKDRSDVIVESYVMSTLSVEEQVKVTVGSSVYVSACGGGAFNAMFLPRGAALILYYDSMQGHPARLDWDYFNNASFMRTSWLHIDTMNENAKLNLLIQLVEHELETIEQLETEDP